MLCNIKNLWTSNPWVIFSQKKYILKKQNKKNCKNEVTFTKLDFCKISIL